MYSLGILLLVYPKCCQKQVRLQSYKVTDTVRNLLRTKDVHLHTPALRIGTHFLLTLETVVFLSHLLSTTSKPFSSLSTRLAHAARLGFFYKKALYKFTVIIIIIIIIMIKEDNRLPRQSPAIAMTRWIVSGSLPSTHSSALWACFVRARTYV